MTEQMLAVPRKRRSRVTWVAGALVVAAVIWWAVFQASLPFVASWWNVDFERGTRLETRYRIADRLVSGGHLNGMARSEVIALLGTPPETDKFQNHGLVYVLGPERGWMSIDYEWLLVDFDSADRVAKVAVVTD
jgi:hypothetical protein